MGSIGKQILRSCSRTEIAKIDAQGMKGTWGDTRLFFYCSLEFAREQYVHFSAKRGVARRKRELGDRSRPHPCPKIDPHSCPKQQKQAGVLLGARLLSCLFPFISFNVVPFTLLGDELHEKFPNSFTTACGLLFHPFLLFLCLLTQISNLSFCISQSDLCCSGFLFGCCCSCLQLCHSTALV